MLEKQFRLKRDKDFQRVFKKGESVFDKACGLKFQRNDLEHSRFAVVVGTKVSKSAVKRNKIRRQYQEILRLHFSELADGFDVIVLCGKESLGMSYEEKEKKLVKILKKAKLAS